MSENEHKLLSGAIDYGIIGSLALLSVLAVITYPHLTAPQSSLSAMVTLA